MTERRRWVSQWLQSQEADFYDTGYKSWYHGMTNVSIPEMNILKNSSTLAVSFPINLCIKVGFVSVNGPRETYFVNVLCRYRNKVTYWQIGGEGWLGFPDLWSDQKPWWDWYLTPVVNFGEVRMAQLAKSNLLTSTLMPLGSFHIF